MVNPNSTQSTRSTLQINPKGLGEYYEYSMINPNSTQSTLEINPERLFSQPLSLSQQALSM